MSSTLKFNFGKFKIMQIADTQENAVVNPDTIKLITMAIEQENPNLVVFTGDQIKGYSSSFSKDTYNRISKTIADILAPIEKHSIPFCVTFGNHDRDCGIPNAAQMDIYQKHNGFICGKMRNEHDKGTYSLQIANSSNEKNILNLYIIDSNAKEPDGCYSPVSKEQVEWYKNERERIKEANGEYLPSLVFQHIPLPEYFRAIKRSTHFTRGSVEAFYSHKNEFYVLDDETIAKGGFMLESPAAPDINNGEFDAFKECGEVLGVFVGHDHNNSFVKNVDGIDLGYTQGCGFNTYGPGKKRGVRIFEFNEEDIKNYKTYTVTMDEVCKGNYKPAKPIWEFIASHAPTSVKQVKRIATDTLTIAASVAAVGYAACKIIKKLK